jgi:hypothetical protein
MLGLETFEPFHHLIELAVAYLGRVVDIIVMVVAVELAAQIQYFFLW